MNKIPRKIHYCWFGRGKKPDIVKRCIESWKEKLEGYEIIEWNEENFDITKNIFVKEAYVAKKYAFVSDYVRVEVLYEYGGIYLDTDVEVFQSFDKYLNEESFWGLEVGNYVATSTIGAKKNSELIKKFLDTYEGKNFINENGLFNMTTNVKIVSEIFKEIGFKLNGDEEKIEGVATIYPVEIFSPYDYRYYQDLRTKDTVAMHHYHKSWVSKKDKIKQALKKIIVRIIGYENIKRLGK